MTPTLTEKLKMPVQGGLLGIIPFAVMELVNVGGASFPFALFFILWFVGALFLFTAATGLHMVKFSTRPPRTALGVLVSVSSLFFAWFWIMVIIDQMPCFLGQAFCD